VRDELGLVPAAELNRHPVRTLDDDEANSLTIERFESFRPE
jgi:hypothetical protein